MGVRRCGPYGVRFCFGGVCWGPARPGVARCLLGVKCCWSLCCGMPFLQGGPGATVVSSFSAPRSLFLPLPGPWVVSSSPVVSLPVPCPCGRLPVTLGPSFPLCRSVPFCPLPSSWPCPFPSRSGGGGVGGGLWGADGPRLGVGGPEPLAKGLRGVGGARPWTTSWRRAYYTACGMVASRGALLGLAGVRVRNSLTVCTVCIPSRLPGPCPTSLSGGAPARRGQTTRRGRQGPEGGRRPSSRSWTGGRRMWTCGRGGRGGAWGRGRGGGGGWGWRTCTGSGRNGNPCGAHGRRGRWTWGGGGVRGGTRGRGSGGSRALGGCGGALGSGSGASERVRRSGAVGSVSAWGGCAVWRESGSAAVCGAGPRRGSSRASNKVLGGPGGPCVVPPGTGGGEEVPRTPLIRRVGVRRRQWLVVRLE